MFYNNIETIQVSDQKIHKKKVFYITNLKFENTLYTCFLTSLIRNLLSKAL